MAQTDLRERDRDAGLAFTQLLDRSRHEAAPAKNKPPVAKKAAGATSKD